MRKCLVVWTLLALFASPVFADEAVWIEGESSPMNTFNRHEWYSAQNVDASALSANGWLAHYAESAQAVAQYEFTIREGGSYTWWLRCNPHQAAYAYSLDGGEFQPIDTTDARDRQNLRTEGIDIRFIAWVKVAEVDLAPGTHRLMLKVLQGEREAHGGIDAMCFANYGWSPSGVGKPKAAEATPLAGGARAGQGTGEYVWIEGEAVDRSSFNQHGWYSASDVDRKALSGGQWLAHYDEARPGAAEWRFRIRQGGRYTWWIRLNPFQVNHRYAIDGSQPKKLPVVDVREQNNVLSQGRDIRQIGWVKGGEFELSPGMHTLVLQVEKGGREAHGAVDCMAFVNFPWAPTGTSKPEVTAPDAAAPDTWFPVYPDDDEFSEASITDMYSVVKEATGIPAGQHGFVQRRGDRLVLSERPERAVKFWGLCAGPAPTVALQRQQARFYVKHGLNMLRKHTVQAEVGLLKKTAPGERGFDPERLDRFDRWFAILKENGIYMTWSCFYPHVITLDEGYPRELYRELPDRGEGKSISGFVNFMPALQDAEWEWLRALLLHENPYTGVRYVDEPALAAVEVHNEDCIFFHAPLNDLAGAGGKYPKHSAILRRRWMEWVKDRYGTDEQLRRAWGQGMRRGDSVDNPSMDIYGAWQFGAEGPDYGEPTGIVRAERRRMGDFIRFLAEMQRGYYERRERRLRELGYRAVTVSTAWRAGGPAADPANLWCDDAMDAIDRHNYFGGGAGGHNIAEGHVNNESHMDQPGSRLLSTGMYQVEDKPFIMTEWTQLPPNQWKAEAAPLFAFYGMGLQGWDASYHFAGHRPRMGSGWPGMRSYVTETPHYIGQFPALAFALHKGHIRQAPIAAARRLALDDIFQGFDVLSQDFTGGGYDQKELQGSLATPKEVLAIGRVTAKFADGLPPSQKADWAEYWDRSARVVRSMTGEMVWDYGQRVVTVQSEKTQGVIGFAGGGTYELPAATLQVKTPFVSLLLTPLDDRPLADSSHILLTAMARDKQTGTQYSADGTQLLKAGNPPLLMEPVQATIALKGAPIQSVKAVDIYGVPTDRTLAHEGGQFVIDGRYASYYYEVKR